MARALVPTVSIKGGPQLAAALAKLEKGLRDDLLKEVTLAGAEVIAEEWRGRVESVIGIGPGVAHYAESIEARSRKGRRGATGIVQLKGRKQPVEQGESQPREYAAKFEFNGKPTLRPAFDNAQGRAVEVMADRLRDLIEAAT